MENAEKTGRPRTSVVEGDVTCVKEMLDEDILTNRSIMKDLLHLVKLCFV